MSVTDTLNLSFLVTEGEVDNVITLDFLVEAGRRGGTIRREKRSFKIEKTWVEVWEDDPLIEVVERVEKALRLFKPVATEDVKKLKRLPGVKKAVERAIRERDDEEAAFMMLIA